MLNHESPPPEWYGCQWLTTMPRTAITRSFSLRQDEIERFEALVERVAGGSTTGFIRRAMDQMEALENGHRFEAVREVGEQRARERGIVTPEQRRAAVQRVLNRPEPEGPTRP